MDPRRKLIAIVLVGVLLAAGGLSWLLLRGKGLVDETLALQSSLLLGGVTGRERAAGVARVTRNVDRMDRGDVKKVRDAFQAEWRQLLRKGVDEYAVAGEADREALLDRDIGRLVAAGQLWFATNPRSSGQPPRPRNPKPTAKKPVETKANPAAPTFEGYRSALLLRAGKRGIQVPEWLLGSR